MGASLVSLIPAFMEAASVLFVSAVGIGTATLGGMAIYDRYIQTSDPVRKKYPLLGRFTNLTNWFGEYFRSHISESDREQKPFSRAERGTAKRMAHRDNDTWSFGSTLDIEKTGTVIFVNSPYPPLDEETKSTSEITYGPYCETPYKSSSIFNVSGMSYGAISSAAVRALSKGAAKAGSWLNTGEGGLSEYHLEGGADLIFQIGTAKYGVRDENGLLSDEKLKDVAANEHVKMFEIKLSQGAKPGKGGILPAEKVTEEVAEIRGIPVGKASISPNRHPEVKNTKELIDFIERVRNVTGKPVGIKTVISSKDWVEELCDEIHKRGIESAPDFITVDGGDGGTGAAPATLMDNVGLSLKEALPILSQTLIEQGLKERIRIVASGKLITPVNVAWALATGADAVNSARGPMFAMGCVQAMRCSSNTCPSGIATHDPKVVGSFNPQDKGEKVGNYLKQMQKQVEILAHTSGSPEPRELRPNQVRVVQNDGTSKLMSEIYPGLKF